MTLDTPRKRVVGYFDTNDENVVYILPDAAWESVNRVHYINSTVKALGRQFWERGWLLDKNEGRWTVQVRIGETKPRVWKFRKSVLFSLEDNL